MPKFSLSPDVDENKIFLLGRGELEGRFDTFYYLDRNKIKTKTTKLKPFIKDVFQGQTQGDNKVEKIKVLKVKNITNDGNFDFENVTYINSIQDRKVLQYGDILTPFRGKTILTNKFAYFEDKTQVCTIDNNLGVIRLDSHKIKPKFFKYYISSDSGFMQIRKNLVGAGIPAITKNMIYSLEIPDLQLNTQQTIIDIMDAAYETKKTKEAKAKELLEGIDDYLLGELGITLPPEPSNTLDERTFEVSFAEIFGGRFDGKSYLIKSPLKTQRYPLVKLKTTADINPLTSFAHFEVNDEISFLPMEKISDIFAEAEEGISKRACESKGYTRFQENDLLWAKITPCMENGKSAVVKNILKGYGFGSTEFHVFRARENLNIVYLHSLLRLKSLRDYAKLFFTGSAGHQRVDAEFFRTLEIPLPPIDTQNRIAEETKQRRDKAKKLQTEAKEVLEKAKKEVEKIILGEIR